MTGESMIDYEALAQEAMRNVVRSVLQETAAKGLPGDHHFYISFDTLAPGVILSKRLREKYAEEMTIVLQHRFWDLIINEHRFEVKLTFDGIPERLVVPFKAVRVFFDPSVRYGLQFESIASSLEASNKADDELDEAFDDPFAGREFDAPGRAPVPLKRDHALRAASEIAPAKAATPKSRGEGEGDDGAAPGDQDNGQDEFAADEASEIENAEVANGGAEIVSLDAFRKK
jgi:hypothetical protein